jgi:Fibronectin type III domain
MPSAQIITSVLIGGAAVAPGDFQFSYRILSGVDYTDLGGLRGVLNEPVFKGSINQGCSTLTLDLDHYPTELAYGNVIFVRYPKGQMAGLWYYEHVESAMAPGKTSYQIVLSPLAVEMTDADFNANYSTDTTQPTAAIGPQPFSQAVTDSLTRVRHCTAGVIQNNGVSYSYVYNNAAPVDTLNQAVTFGGSTWWWYIDSVGVVTLRNSSPYAHVVTLGRECVSGKWTEDISSLYNGQPVLGGTPAGGLTSLSAFAVDTNTANPYSVPNLGRRTAKPYSDTSLLDQASVNAVATSLLAYAERVTRQMTLRLTNYYVRRPQPGDAIRIRLISPDPSLGAGGTGGPYLITDVTEYGATGTYDLVISADMTVPIGVFNPTMSADQAVAKLAANPAILSLSPDGSTGTVGAGVVAGDGGGAGYSAIPSVPLGLTGTTGIDILSQTNNAYVNLTWSANASTDAVTGYEVQWRKFSDTLFYRARASVPAIKIPGLIQGQLYSFSIAAQNSLGVYSAFSSETTVQAATDAVAPAPPTGLAAIRTPRGALVSWNGNTEPDLQGYLLQVSVAGAGFSAVNSAPNLHNSYSFVAPSGTATGSTLVFRVAAVDWTGNQSAWSTATATVSDGVVFDEIMTGNLTAVGTITGGTIQTSATGPRVQFDNSGIRLYDGTATDHGSGIPGLTTMLRGADGSAFFSGNIAATSISSPPGVTPSATLDLTGIPNLIFFDTNGIDRAQIGQFTSLADLTQQYGMQILDPTGRLLYDTVIGVNSNNHFGSFANGPFTTTSTTTTPLGPTVAFTLPYRAQNVYVNIKGAATLSWAGGYAGQTAWLNTTITGAGPGANAIPFGYNTGSAAEILPFGYMHTFYNVPVGSYVAVILGYLSGSATLSISQCSVDVFLLGGPNAGN